MDIKERICKKIDDILSFPPLMFGGKTAVEMQVLSLLEVLYDTFPKEVFDSYLSFLEKTFGKSNLGLSDLDLTDEDFILTMKRFVSETHYKNKEKNA